MITLRSAQQRGHFAIDWLDSWHTFSFGEYHDPAHMGCGPLRVINDDTVAPQGGFATHGHRDMEIISYVLDGELEHRDSLGTGSIIRPREIQRMRAGSGIRHSEYNPSPDHAVHFLQIWIVPHTNGLQPGYAQQAIPALDDQWILLAGPEGSGALVDIAADARLFSARLRAGSRLARSLEQPLAWLHVARGTVQLAGHTLAAGDGVRIENEQQLDIVADADAELLLFSLPRQVGGS